MTKAISVVLLALLLAGCNKDPQAVRQAASEAMGSGDYEQAEEHFRWLLERKPDDARLRANLAFSLTEQGRHDEAIGIYSELIEESEGTYDLFAYYARSLDGAGRAEDAIVWNYRTLSVLPQLVDVRRDLAKILTRHGRPFEALSLLASFDGQLEEKGQNPYFHAQRIAIASNLPPASDDAKPGDSFRSVKLGGHFYSVAIGAKGESLPFLIDTGATHTTVSPESLRRLGLDVPASAKPVRMRTADDRAITARQFSLPSLQLGPYRLDHVQIVVCEYCASLLGQSTLERFDIATSKSDGLEILSMRLRATHPDSDNRPQGL